MLKEITAGKRRTALGQGLDSLLPLTDPLAANKSDGDVTFLELDSLVPNPYQPRRLFNEQSLADLANSIKEKGVIQPLIVRRTATRTYEIVAGERRWKAARLAGFTTIPVLVRDMSDSESLEIALIENLQREDLNPLDTAEAYELLIKKFSYTHEILAKSIGKDRTSITNYLRILRLPDPVKEDIRRENLSMGHAKTLLAVDHLPTLLRLSRKVVNRRLSVHDLERIVQNYNQKKKVAGSRVKTKDPSTATMETALSRYFSTKVQVNLKPNGMGKLEILFHSREELDRLLEVMGYSEDFS
jgi:ParB family transcriptional regulator, chromosome partitioning protein